uniref:Uncharacterized protein n=1 Tax=Romanomermis culicivorax TaxID=13658 RepID=A0A915ICZ8_ROMCU
MAAQASSTTGMSVQPKVTPTKHSRNQTKTTQSSVPPQIKCSLEALKNLPPQPGFKAPLPPALSMDIETTTSKSKTATMTTASLLTRASTSVPSTTVTSMLVISTQVATTTSTATSQLSLVIATRPVLGAVPGLIFSIDKGRGPKAQAPACSQQALENPLRVLSSTSCIPVHYCCVLLSMWDNFLIIPPMHCLYM